MTDSDARGNNSLSGKIKSLAANRKAAFVLSIVWIIILVTVLVLLSGAFPLRIRATFLFLAFLVIGSVLVLFVDLNNRRHVKLGKAVLVLATLTIAWSVLTMHTYTIINNPFTSQTFAAKYDIGWTMKGTTTYYRRWGPFLYNGQKTEIGQIMPDRAYVSVKRNDIYVNATFMGRGGSFPVYNDHINLWSNFVEEWSIEKNFPSDSEYFILTGNKKRLARYKYGSPPDVAYLSPDEYQKAIAMLKILPLVDYPDGRDEGYYTLEVKLTGEVEDTYYAPTYMAVIDGEDAFEFLSDIIEQHH